MAPNDNSQKYSMSNFDFQKIDWDSISATEHPGHTGIAMCRTVCDVRIARVLPRHPYCIITKNEVLWPIQAPLY